MAISNIKAVFQSDIQTVWEVVTSLTDYAWRSDLDRIEVLDENRFIEYTKEGFPTTFTITTTERCRRWEFDMQNSNMTGHWTGVFSERDGKTEIAFTEEVTAKKFFLKPFLNAFLKKQQSRYVEDLNKELERRK